jgi:hypothetical protein
MLETVARPMWLPNRTPGDLAQDADLMANEHEVGCVAGSTSR